MPGTLTFPGVSTTPTAPSTGQFSLYIKSATGIPYVLNSSGVESGLTGAVSSVFGRTGAVVATLNDYTWAQINKTTSSLADVTDRSHTLLNDIGTNTHSQLDSHVGDGTIHYTVGTIDHNSLLNTHNLTTDITHSAITGITTTDAGHTQFALLAGRAGGQILTGGTAASEGLTLKSTSDATKGPVYITEANDFCLSIYGTAPNARKARSIDMLLNRDAATQTVQSGAGYYSAMFGGDRNYISSTGPCNTIIGGALSYITTASTSCSYNIVLGGTSNSVAGGWANNAVVGGNGNSCRNNANGMVILGGASNLSDANYSVVSGEANQSSHSHGAVFGKGGTTTAAYDLCWSNYNVAASYSNANVAFRLNGVTADVHVGRHVNSATAGSNTNILKLHTINANNQSNYVGLQAGVTAAASYTLIFPTTLGSAGQALRIASIAGTEATMEWYTP